MPSSKEAVRQSVSLPPAVARRVKALARTRRTSASRVLVELIETGLEARDAEKARFMALADQLTASTDTDEQARLKEELARLTFGS
jgi:predicted transcriptional regulator